VLPWKSKRFSIFTRVALAGSFSLVFFAFAMLFVIENELQHAIYHEIDARVRSAGGTLSELTLAKGPPTVVRGVLRFGSWVANEDVRVVDRVRALSGADATLFAVRDGKPVRVSTTIRNPNGFERNTGTELRGPARVAFDAGRDFVGVSRVAGRLFIDRYVAVKDASGRRVAILYTGIPLTDMDVAVAHAMRAVVVATAIGLLVCISLLNAVMVPMRRAFRNAVAIAQGLSAGDVDQRSDYVPEGELGQMSVAFTDMITYQQRMAALADNLAAGDFTNEVVPVSDRDRLGIAFAQMSANLKGLVRQLEASAMTDSLTLLGNRRAFDARMRAELSRAARHNGYVWLALVDIDNFKVVNDENGHQHGDVVLSRVGTLLRDIRAEDSAYRLGGDEFAVVLTDCSRGDAERALERLRAAAPNQLFGTTISIGFAGSPQGLLDTESLLRQADAALYVCKQSGRNTLVDFDSAQRRGDIPHQMNMHAVSRLIAERGLVVAFQPIWDIARGKVLGYEALARPDPKYGLDGPQEAFEIAAKLGRSHDLDRVCREAAVLAAVELPPESLLFLNVAPESLVRGEIDRHSLASTLDSVGLRPERVVLEITERYSGPVNPVVAAARAFQRSGFRLALDDTGAGNAGLHYLSRLKVDFIKIDGAIVAKAATDTAARGVVAAIVALAKTTKAYVIAEGIEDPNVLDILKRSGIAGAAEPFAVNGAQGYYLGRPGAIAEAPTEGARRSMLRVVEQGA
jgi:diguanylate cyclase (GGDEF)-like protein